MKTTHFKNTVHTFVLVSLLLTLLGSAAFPPNARAAAIWYVATTGDDANSCADIAAPCLTINAAIGKSTDGDTVEVAVGTYPNSGGATIQIDKSIILSGGWDAGFENQTGDSLINSGVKILNSNPTVTLSNFTISGSNNGGVQMASGTLTISNSTITNNALEFGGGIFITSGALTINNSIIANNLASYGGGIYQNSGILTINNSTISNNRAEQAGGGVVGIDIAAIRNSIIANNTAGWAQNCSGTIEISDHNIIGDGGCTIIADSGTQLNVDPMLGTFLPLQGYFPLLPGSPAINAGNPETCLSTDQRGIARVDGCDIGAYEYTIPGAAASLAVVSGNNQLVAPGSTFATPFKVVVLDAQGSPVPGVEVIFTAPASGASGTFADTGTNTTSVLTDAGGLATASAFTANSELGQYMVSAAVDGIAPTDFSVENMVWFVSPFGDDANSCATSIAPCLTINSAIGKAASGDMIKVAAGTYTGSGNEVVLIQKDITLSGGWDGRFTTQSGESIIDGQGASRGITVNSPATVAVDRFRIQHGYANGNNGYSGGGIDNSGTLTLEHSVVSDNISWLMGGGINNSGTLTINNTTISGNTAGTDYYDGRGGGIENYGGILIIDNSTVSNNIIIGDSSGSGIDDTSGKVFLNNSTISGNTGGSGEGIRQLNGTASFNNSTISGNQTYGFVNHGGKIILQNTIIAGNGVDGDCSNASYAAGTVISNGYNLIGNRTGCGFIPTTGDLFGTSSNPIDPRLGPLQDNGGPTFTHSLFYDSPALNAGNSVIPGSGGNACLATDQRGVARPAGSACDIGAYELALPTVAAINLVNPSPTIAPIVKFKVTFSEAVTGVDTKAPFSDFILTTTGVTGAVITAVARNAGDTYTVSVTTGRDNGTIRLDVLDDDSIQNAAGEPLGGPGAGNGNFTLGAKYSVRKIPTLLAPLGAISILTPTYKWTTVPRATKYQYQVVRGATTIYTKTVATTACKGTVCLDTPTTVLKNGMYQWRIRALAGGVWQSYSDPQFFTVDAPKYGYWSGGGVDFYATTYSTVNSFSIYVTVKPCGNYQITYAKPLSVVNKKFSFTGSFYASGTFVSSIRASGKLGLKLFYLPGCGYLTGGPYTWSAAWRHSAPAPLIRTMGLDPIVVEPAPDGISEFITIEPIKP